MQKYYVYIWFLVDTKEVFYVGKGSGNRVTSMKDRNKHFRNIRKKCNCDYEIVKYFDNEEDAYNYEKELGIKYKNIGQAWCCYVLGKTDKYISNEIKRRISLTLNGRSSWNKGKKMSDEQRAKLSEIKKGYLQSDESKRKRSISLLGHKVSKQTRLKISISKMGNKNPMFGKKQTKETIMKRVKKMKGHKVSERTRELIGLANGKKVAQIDINSNEILQIYNSASEAARANGLNNSKISSVCNGRRKTTGGYRWEYLDKAIPS